MADESTINRWRSVRSTRRGRPRAVASAPATSGTGMGGSTGATLGGWEEDTPDVNQRGWLREAIDRRFADDGSAIVVGHPFGDLSGVGGIAAAAENDFAVSVVRGQAAPSGLDVVGDLSGVDVIDERLQ